MSNGRRMSCRLQDQPDIDDLQLGRAMRVANLRDIEVTTGYFRATTLLRMWSLLTPTDARECMVTGSIRWDTVAQAIFNWFGWRSCNRIGI